MSKLDQVSEKRVYAVPRELNDELNNIAKNIGTTKSSFLRKEIRSSLELLEPRYVIKDEGTNIFITGVGPQLDSKITAIAKDMGISRNSLLKVLLYNITGKYSPNMKKPNKGLSIDIEE